MLGIDTNVLVRFLVRDDELQYERARKLIRREGAADEDVFLSLVVLLETEWVLRSRYSLLKTEIMETMSDLLSAKEIQFEHEPAVEEALHLWTDSTAEFADCLISAHHRRLGCRATATFDIKAARLPSFVAL